MDIIVVKPKNKEDFDLVIMLMKRIRIKTSIEKDTPVKVPQKSKKL